MKTIRYLLGGVLLVIVAASCNTNDSNRKKEVADVNTPESSSQQEQLVEEHVLLAEAYVVRRAKKATEQAGITTAVPKGDLAVAMEEDTVGELEKSITVIDRIKRESIELASADEPVVAIGELQLANAEVWRGEAAANIQEGNNQQEGKYDINMANLQGKFNAQEFEDIVQSMVAGGKWEFIDRDNKEIWRAKLADGSQLRYKLKDSKHKDVFKENDGNSRDFIKEKKTENKYVEKVKEDGQRKVRKVKNKGDEMVIKEKYNGIKSVERIRV